jgi:hypothetical protein
VIAMQPLFYVEWFAAPVAGTTRYQIALELCDALLVFPSQSALCRRLLMRPHRCLLSAPQSQQ